MSSHGTSIRHKRICVTGGAGFLGRAVVKRLTNQGCEAVSVIRKKDYDLVRGGDVERLYTDVNPEVVIHLAAVVGGIGANAQNPGRFFYENMMMGAQLIEGARKHSVEKFVQIGTVCSYPKHTSVPFREDDIWSGYPEETNAPYGIAKKALLVQCQAYRDQYGLNAIYLMPANLYGPGDNFDPESSHVIPALIRKFIEAVDGGAPAVELWGSGEPTREFLYVDDAAEAIVVATERFNGREPVNLGSGMEISIRDLAHKIASAAGFTGRIIWDGTRPDGQPRRSLDTSRAAELFGFRTRTNFDQGLSQTIRWYRGTLARQSRPAAV